MKKQIATLVGTAALMSILTLSAATTTPTVRPVKKNTKSGAQSQQPKDIDSHGVAVMNDVMAQDLSVALGTTKASVLADLNTGKTVKDIIAASGKSEADVEVALKAAHKSAMVKQVDAQAAAGTISASKAAELKQKMQSNEIDKTPITPKTSIKTKKTPTKKTTTTTQTTAAQ